MFILRDGGQPRPRYHPSKIITIERDGNAVMHDFVHGSNRALPDESSEVGYQLCFLADGERVIAHVA